MWCQKFMWPGVPKVLASPVCGSWRNRSKMKLGMVWQSWLWLKEFSEDVKGWRPFQSHMLHLQLIWLSLSVFGDWLVCSSVTLKPVKTVSIATGPLTSDAKSQNCWCLSTLFLILSPFLPFLCRALCCRSASLPLIGIWHILHAISKCEM